MISNTATMATYTKEHTAIALLTGHIPESNCDKGETHPSIKGGTFVTCPYDLDKSSEKVIQANMKSIARRRGGKRKKFLFVSMDASRRNDKMRDRLRAKLKKRCPSRK